MRSSILLFCFGVLLYSCKKTEDSSAVISNTPGDKYVGEYLDVSSCGQTYTVTITAPNHSPNYRQIIYSKYTKADLNIINDSSFTFSMSTGAGSTWSYWAKGNGYISGDTLIAKIYNIEYIYHYGDTASAGQVHSDTLSVCDHKYYKK